MAEIKLSVSETKLTLIEPKSLVGTGVNYDTCTFSFGSEWEGYSKTAVFYSNFHKEPIAMILDERNSCIVPWETIQEWGILFIGAFGVKDNIEIPTNLINIVIQEGAAGNNAPPPPSLSAYKQILDKVAEVKAVEDSFNAAELERKNNEEERQRAYLEFKGDTQSGTGLKNELKENITTGIELDNKLKEDIVTGSTLDLILKEDITLGDALNLKLKEDIETGNTLKTEIEKDITTANTSKENLDKVIETANTTTYATKGEIQKVNASLAENKQQINERVDNIINGVTVDTEVIDSRNSAIKGKNYTVLDERIEDVEKDSYFPIKNLIPNGDFSNGTTGWSNSGATNFVVAGGVASFLATQTSGGIYQPPFGGSIIGRKYYCMAYVKSESQNINLSFGSTVINHNGNNTMQLLSLVHTATTIGHALSIKDARVNGWTNVFIDNACIIDLTVTFGVGNEPTKEEMDRILSYYPNNWFDGTVNLAENSKMLKFLLNEIRGKATIKQEEWITPTLLNGWIAFDDRSIPKYRKDSFGNVIMKGSVKSGSTGGAVFVLPAGYRPLETWSFPKGDSYIINNGSVYVASTVKSSFDGNVIPTT